MEDIIFGLLISVLILSLVTILGCVFAFIWCSSAYNILVVKICLTASISGGIAAIIGNYLAEKYGK